MQEMLKSHPEFVQWRPTFTHGEMSNLWHKLKKAEKNPELCSLMDQAQELSKSKDGGKTIHKRVCLGFLLAYKETWQQLAAEHLREVASEPIQNKLKRISPNHRRGRTPITASPASNASAYAVHYFRCTLANGIFIYIFYNTYIQLPHCVFVSLFKISVRK